MPDKANGPLPEAPELRETAQAKGGRWECSAPSGLFDRWPRYPNPTRSVTGMPPGRRWMRPCFQPTAWLHRVWEEQRPRHRAW